MSKNPNLARHRATPVSPMKSVSKAVSSNAGAIGRPVAVVAAASGMMFGLAAPANAAGELNTTANTASSVQQQATVSAASGAAVSYDRASVSSSAGAHTVQAGDTLGKIAAQYGVSLESVFAANGLSWNSVIYPGQVIQLSGTANGYSAAGSVDQASVSASNTTGLSTASNNVQTLSTGSAAAGVSASGIAGLAKSMVGTPYVWGGTSPSAGWDCSGFVQWVYAQNGIDLPRTYQWNSMTPTSNPQPGDVVVQNGGSHVGIYLGGGKMVSALNPSQGTLVHNVSAMSVVGYYTM